MRLAATFSICLLVTAGAFAQTTTRSFGSVVFPGGTSATTPGVTRNFGSVVFPGSSNVPAAHTPPVIVGIPRTGLRPGAAASGQNFRRSNVGSHGNRTNTFVYAYPVFVGGGYENSFVGGEPQMAPPLQPAAPMAYPSEPARPVIIQVGPEYPSRAPMSAYQPAPSTGASDEPAPSSERYLLAFKDHTVYSATAYWFDGDTLHYFTAGNVHNQASVSLLDRELTQRLNRELGIDFRMPGVK